MDSVQIKTDSKSLFIQITVPDGRERKQIKQNITSKFEYFALVIKWVMGMNVGTYSSRAWSRYLVGE